MDGTTKSLIFGIGGFIAGLAVGGAGVYVYSKRYFEEKSNADIQEMAEYYNKKYGLKEEKKDEAISKKESDEEVKEAGIQAEYENISDIYSAPKSSEPPVAYTNFFGDSDGSSDKPASKKKGGRKKKVTGPVRVEDDVWDNIPSGWDSRFLVYYEADDVLMDEESEQVLEDKESLVGNDILKDNKDDIVIISNEQLHTIYHVTVEKMAYSEAMVDD